MSDEKVLEFAKRYQVIADANILPDSKNIFIGNKGKCRYCRREQPMATFKKRAHAIPEMLGNKRLFSNDECDECNDVISKVLENNLAKYLGASRTISQIKGKQGVPTYKSPKKRSRIEIKESGLYIAEYADDKLTDIDFAEKRIKIFAITHPYVPAAVYKCLVKICVAIMPENDLMQISRTTSWIVDQSNDPKMFSYSPLLAFKIYIPGPCPLPGIRIFLSKKRNVEYLLPEYMGLVAFSNFIYQFVVPAIEKDSILTGKKISIPLIPSPIEGETEFGKAQYSVEDMSSYLQTEKRETPLFMHYESFMHNKGK